MAISATLSLGPRFWMNRHTHTHFKPCCSQTLLSCLLANNKATIFRRHWRRRSGRIIHHKGEEKVTVPQTDPFTAVREAVLRFVFYMVIIIVSDLDRHVHMLVVSGVRMMTTTTSYAISALFIQHLFLGSAICAGTATKFSAAAPRRQQQQQGFGILDTSSDGGDPELDLFGSGSGGGDSDQDREGNGHVALHVVPAPPPCPPPFSLSLFSLFSLSPTSILLLHHLLPPALSAL
jgi:hypothetical protein